LQSINFSSKGGLRRRRGEASQLKYGDSVWNQGEKSSNRFGEWSDKRGESAASAGGSDQG
jgi:hypothetical protein